MTKKDIEAQHRRHVKGTLVIIALAMVFFTLLALLVLYWPRPEDTKQVASEELLVVPLELKIRTQPSGKAPVVATVTRGEIVYLDETKESWARVRNRDGLSGWTERNLLETEVERERRQSKAESIRGLPPLDGVIDQTTPVFAGPGIFYPEVGQIERGEKVRVFTRDHDYFAIDLANEIVYVDANDVDITGTSGARFQVAANEASESPEPLRDWPLEDEGRDIGPDFVPARPDVAEAVAAVLSSPGPDGVFATVPPGGTEPQLVERITPHYPISARRSGIEGTVIIRAIVRKDGTVDSAQILKDLPFGLGEAAKNAVERWRFHPATLDGHPIDVYYTVTVNYSMRTR